MKKEFTMPEVKLIENEALRTDPGKGQGAIHGNGGGNGNGNHYGLGGGSIVGGVFGS